MLAVLHALIIGICNRVGEVHHASPIGTMVKTDDVSQLVHSLLLCPLFEELFVMRCAIELWTKSLQGYECFVSKSQSKDEVQSFYIDISLCHP